MNAKHTPGPWMTWNKGGHNFIRDANALVVSRVEHVNTGKRKTTDIDIEISNARLIAAAPDLLEALKNSLAVIEFMAAEMGRLDAVRGSAGYGLARAAINAALGE